MSEMHGEVPKRVTGSLKPGEFLRKWAERRRAERVMANPEGAQPGEFVRAFTNTKDASSESEKLNPSADATSQPISIAQQQESRIARIRAAVKQYVKKSA